MNSSKITDRKFEFDVMRTVSAVAVVCIHTCAMRWRSIDINSFEWLVTTVFHMLCKFSVPLFFMISGRFHLDEARDLSLKTIFTKRIFKLVVAFVFWSLVYTVKNIILEESVVENWKLLIIKFITGEYHMWFVFVIVCLYLITPLLRPIAADKKLCEYYLLLFFVFQLFLPFLSIVPHIGILVSEITNKSQMMFVMGYSGYFLLGSYLSKYNFSAKSRAVCYAVGIVGALFSVFVVIKMSRISGTADESLAEYLTWNVAAETVAIYVLISQLFKGKSSKVISIIAKYSFGIYLSHPLVLWIFSLVGFMPNFANPIIGIPIVTVLALILSLFISVALRRIPILGKKIT